MLLSTTPSELFPLLTSIPKTPHTSPMRTALTLSLFRSLSSPLPLLHHHHHHHYRRLLLRTVSVINNQKYPFKNPPYLSPLAVNSTPSASVSTLVERVAVKSVGEENWDFSSNEEADVFDFDASFDSSAELKRLDNAGLSVVVKDLDELPEQWRRSKLAWLCKELPAHKPAALIRILNGQKKWVRQDDLTYVAVHCMRIRENETGFRVYKWMMQQHWFKFDFSLATKLADCMGKERKYLKCREIFNDMINQGRVPTESTFHILTIAYLSSSARGCLEEACAIYNRMIQLGGYRPQLTLHNSLFKALLSGPGGSSKHYLKQAEFIFHNMVTSGFKIHRDVYGGLIWLHSYQDRIDKERIESLRAEMQLAGFEERREVLVSILRACSKEGNVEEAERTWIKLLSSRNSIPSQAFVYKMEVYARIGEPMKSLEVFRDMQEQLGTASTVAFHKIIEVLSKAQAIGLSESMMKEFMNSGMKPLKPAFADLMDMYSCLSLHDKLESTFFQCLEVCHPNRTIYNIYLNSLVQVGNLDKAEEIFNQMQGDCAVGVDTRSCNTILRAYLSSEDYAKAEKTYDFMCRKKYNIEPSLIQKLDYGLSLNRRVVKKPPTPKLSKEQREILVGLLLGGLQIESDDARKNHVLFFQFNQNSPPHSLLKRHIHNHYHEWLAPYSKQTDGSDDVPCEFATIPNSYFGFYADQFWPKGRPEIPKLVHRWLSPRVLAYWYMYGGYRTSSGDILLKLRGDREGVENVVKALKAKSLVCRVKRKGRWFWIGFLGSNSSWFWKLIEPFVLEDLKDDLKAEGAGNAQNIRFDSETDSYDRDSDFSENENS